MSSEQWKWIPGYLGLYKVSTFGRVASFKTHRPKLLKLHPHVGTGHLKVTIVGHRGELQSYYVSRLVLASFVSTPQEGDRVEHLDGDIENNRLENLKWASKKSDD